MYGDTSLFKVLRISVCSCSSVDRTSKSTLALLQVSGNVTGDGEERMQELEDEKECSKMLSSGRDTLLHVRAH